MTINLKGPELRELKPRIMVCGVGGAGGNAVNIINYATLLASADFGDAEQKQSMVGETINHLRNFNGQSIPHRS